MTAALAQKHDTVKRPLIERWLTRRSTAIRVLLSPQFAMPRSSAPLQPLLKRLLVFSVATMQGKDQCKCKCSDIKVSVRAGR